MNFRLMRELVTDPGVEALLTPEAEIRAMLDVEAALARAEERAGVLPPGVGERLSREIDAATITPEEIYSGAAAAGVAVPTLVATLRTRLPEEIADHLHHGATSQDVVDTAAILRLREICRRIDEALLKASRHLGELARAHTDTPMVGRTRFQHATPITFGLRAANWLAPLTRLRRRIATLEQDTFAVQFGGAAGDLAALGSKGIEVGEILADELGLMRALPWHAQRDRMIEIAEWLGAVVRQCGTIGQDLILLTQTEIAEIRLGSTGASSTMPQKQNPVGPEAMVALARAALPHLTTMQMAGLHAHERDGAAWTSEWISLSAVASHAGGACWLLTETLANLQPDKQRMAANLQSSGGLVFAEAAAFALTPQMGRARAQAHVKEVALRCAQSGAPFLTALQATLDDPSVLQGIDKYGSTSLREIIERILSEADLGGG